jgi:2-(1,2-epoxy-1,2-dihydrophenyl)acetyl-CoA isomerase
MPVCCRREIGQRNREAIMAASGCIKTGRQDGVLTITLDRPKANAFNQVMIDELLAELKQAASDEEIRCLVLTGAGRFFSTGQDIKVFSESPEPVSFRWHLERTYNRIVVRLRQLEKPVIGAINGPAAGAGLGIALATDLRVCAKSAAFIFGFSGIGLTTDSGTSVMLPLLIGLARASEMALTNQPLSAEQALTYGLVNQVVADEDLLSHAQQIARQLAAGPTRAYGLTKRAFNRAVLPGLEAALDHEAYLQELAGRTEDHRDSR